MTLDEFLVCSDLCEESGFARQAALLRAVGREGGRLYVLAERRPERDEYHEPTYESLPTGSYDDRPLPGEPRAVFTDRERAEGEADLRNARRFREINPLRYCGDDGLENLDEICDLTRDMLEYRIGEILGARFRLPAEGRRSATLFPPSATDEQMLAIVSLFTLRFFHVMEVPVAVGPDYEDDGHDPRTEEVGHDG